MRKDPLANENQTAMQDIVHRKLSVSIHTLRSTKTLCFPLERINKKKKKKKLIVVTFWGKGVNEGHFIPFSVLYIFMMYTKHYYSLKIKYFKIKILKLRWRET